MGNYMQQMPSLLSLPASKIVRHATPKWAVSAYLVHPRADASALLGVNLQLETHTQHSTAQHNRPYVDMAAAMQFSRQSLQNQLLSKGLSGYALLYADTMTADAGGAGSGRTTPGWPWFTQVQYISTACSPLPLPQLPHPSPPPAPAKTLGGQLGPTPTPAKQTHRGKNCCCDCPSPQDAAHFWPH